MRDREATILQTELTAQGLRPVITDAFSGALRGFQRAKAQEQGCARAGTGLPLIAALPHRRVPVITSAWRT